MALKAKAFSIIRLRDPQEPARSATRPWRVQPGEPFQSCRQSIKGRPTTFSIARPSSALRCRSKVAARWPPIKLASMRHWRKPIHRRHKSHQGIHRRQWLPQDLRATWTSSSSSMRWSSPSTSMRSYCSPATATSVRRSRRCGVCVTVVSTIFEPAGNELRRQAGVFTDLVELQSKLGHDPSERPAPHGPSP
jgi:hypothetical protein